MEKKKKKIAALMQGHTLPFDVEYILRAWDQTREGLAAKTAAINGMNGAQGIRSAVFGNSRQFFSCARTIAPTSTTWRGISVSPI